MLVAKHGKSSLPRRSSRSSSSTTNRVSLRADSNPFVTIAIPTFNRASLLKECILSVLSQTYPNYEIIVSDNASTDDTQKVLQQFRGQKLRVVTQKNNIGLLPNWNACLAEAKGEYFLLVSDDDKISPWLLESSVALVRRDRQIPIVIALSEVYFPDVERAWQPHSKLKTGIWNGVDILEELLKLPMLAGMSTYMIRSDALRALGGFPVDHPHAADRAVWATLLSTGKAGFVNKTCGLLRLQNSARETSRLSIDLRLSDSERVTSELIDMADRSIKDPKKRDKIKSLYKRYASRSVFLNLAQYRREGAKLKDVLPLIWQWRAKLKDVGVSFIPELLFALIMFFLPPQVAIWSRHFRRSYRHSWNGNSPKRLPFTSMRYLD